MKVVSAPVITCRHCNGSGKSVLKGKALETYLAIGKGPGKTIPELRNALGLNGDDSTANKRIKKLLKFGVARRVRKQGYLDRYAWVNGA